MQNVHQGYQAETLARFLKAREWSVSKAHKMVSFLELDKPKKSTLLPF